MRSPGGESSTSVDSAVFTAGPGPRFRRILFLEKPLVGKTLGAMSTKNPVRRFAQRLQYSVVRKTLTMLIVFVSGSLVGLDLKTERSVVQRIVGDEGFGIIMLLNDLSFLLVLLLDVVLHVVVYGVCHDREHAFFRQANVWHAIDVLMLLATFATMVVPAQDRSSDGFRAIGLVKALRLLADLADEGLA